MKRSQLKSIIKETVLEVMEDELKEQISKYAKRIVQVYSPIVVQELTEDLVKKTLNEMMSNSNQGGSINESSSSSLSALMEGDDEEWPTLTAGKILDHDRKVNQGSDQGNSLSRAQIASMLGYGDAGPSGGGNSLTVVDEAGNSRNIPNDAIPPSINKALNRDYSELMKAVNDKVKNRRGI